MDMNKLMVNIIPFALLIIVMYFFLIRPQKKKEKKINDMRSSLNVGDEIVTIGGICGKIVKTKDDTIVIQVGADKTKFEMTRWSVSSVVKSERASYEAKVEDVEEETKKSLPKKLKKAEKEDTDN